MEAQPQYAVDRRPDRAGQFVTYGRAAYLDVCLEGADPEANYYNALPRSNAGLWEMFSDFYLKLQRTLEELLGDSVTYRPDCLALPGVHVFRGEGIRGAQYGGVHFDVQYQRLRLPEELDPDAEPISVTIPLRLPSCGTGLQVHHITHADYVRAYNMGRINKLDDLARRKTSAYHSYTIGHMVLHRGLILHRLLSPGPIQASDERITVQGHGIRLKGKWILYW